MTEQATKSKKEIVRDRMLGVVMIVSGITLTMIGLKESHISMVWPVVGVAGISLFVDSFLTQKPVKITLNVVTILALAVVYFSVKHFNESNEAKDPVQPNPIEVVE